VALLVSQLSGSRRRQRRHMSGRSKLTLLTLTILRRWRLVGWWASQSSEHGRAETKRAALSPPLLHTPSRCPLMCTRCHALCPGARVLPIAALQVCCAQSSSRRHQSPLLACSRCREAQVVPAWRRVRRRRQRRALQSLREHWTWPPSAGSGRVRARAHVAGQLSRAVQGQGRSLGIALCLEPAASHLACAPFDEQTAGRRTAHSPLVRVAAVELVCARSPEDQALLGPLQRASATTRALRARRPVLRLTGDV